MNNNPIITGKYHLKSYFFVITKFNINEYITLTNNTHKIDTI